MLGKQAASDCVKRTSGKAELSLIYQRETILRVTTFICERVPYKIVESLLR